jgi:hypothetical protein
MYTYIINYEASQDVLIINPFQKWSNHVQLHIRRPSSEDPVSPPGKVFPEVTSHEATPTKICHQIVTFKASNIQFRRRMDTSLKAPGVNGTLFNTIEDAIESFSSFPLNGHADM